jgi:Uma2 family endonuclease
MLQPMDEPSLESIRRISRKEYHLMAERGIFTEDDRIELLDGMLVTKMTRGGPHDRVVTWLNKRIVRALDDSLELRPQCGFAASEWSEPEPDLAIVRADPSLVDHPSEALLVIEVSDSSVCRDRGWKQRIYARASVPEYWVVNLQDRCVEVFTRPSGEGYTTHRVCRGTDVLRPSLVAGIEIVVDEMPLSLTGT